MTSPDWTIGGQRDPRGTIFDVRARAARGERLSGDDFGRLHAEGDDELLWRNAVMRAQRRKESAE